MIYISQKNSRIKSTVICSFLVIFTCFATLSFAAVGIHNYYGNLTAFERQLLKDNERAHLGKALSNLKLGQRHRLKYAEADFNYILAIWPNHPKSLEGITQVALRLGKPDLAEKRFSKALATFPDVAETYALYGIFLYKQDNMARAIDNLEIALKLDPTSSQNHYLLGLSHFANKQFTQANHHAQKAYALGYPLPGLRNKLKRMGNWQSAQDNETD